MKTYSGHTNDAYCIFSTIVMVTEASAAPGDGAGGGGDAMDVAGAGGGRPLLASGSEDGSIYMWDFQSREVVQKLEGHTDCVNSVSSHPTLPIIASGSLTKDCTVRIWGA